SLIKAFRIVLDDDTPDPAWRALALRLPTFAAIADQIPAIDVEGIDRTLRSLRATLAVALSAQWAAVYRRYHDLTPYAHDFASAGRRALANRALGFLAHDADGRQRALEHYRNADNMTDVWGALVALNDTDSVARAAALSNFRQRWHADSLLLDKWLMLQATSALPDRLPAIAAIWNDPAFDRRNPNRVRALLNAFTQDNWPQFHHESGDAYAFIADSVLNLDPQNPQLAARLARAFDPWRRFDAPRQALMRAQLERIAAAPQLSADVRELVSKALSNQQSAGWEESFAQLCPARASR
ncbi:MAG: aminopeptidase N C-terminal domain-containing protein, partial [Betaproteobacteria bacterium]